MSRLNLIVFAASFGLTSGQGAPQEPIAPLPPRVPVVAPVAPVPPVPPVAPAIAWAGALGSALPLLPLPPMVPEIGEYILVYCRLICADSMEALAEAIFASSSCTAATALS